MGRGEPSNMEGGNDPKKKNADQAVELWWHDCCTTRRVNQGPGKRYQPRAKENIQGPSTVPEHDSDSEEVHWELDDWDKWFKSPEDSESDCSDALNSNSDS